MHEGTCAECGATFQARAKTSRYCSKQCRWRVDSRKFAASGKKNQAQKARRARLKAELRFTCCMCGSPFGAIGENGITPRYCSDACHHEGKRQRYHGGNTCKRCGTDVSAAATYCSAACRAWVDAGRRLATAAKGSRGGAPWVSGPCVICGQSFTSNQGTTLVCSRRCRVKQNKRNHRRNHGSGTHRKRARRYGVAYEPVSPRLIFERDGWLCGICGEPVDRDAKCPDPLSPSIDHVIPMSRGGPHLAANIQCAHFECNWLKGDDLPLSTAESDGGGLAA